MTGLYSVRKLTAALLTFRCLALPSQPCTFAQDAAGSSDEVLLKEISRAAFLFFVNEADPDSGLVRDKTGVEYCSTASVGFGLAAPPVAAERDWISRKGAETRALRALRTLASSSAHHQGAFCHYIDLRTGEPTELGYEQVASTIDTALLMGGRNNSGPVLLGRMPEVGE